MVDVPATLGSRIRLLGCGNCEKGNHRVAALRAVVARVWSPTTHSATAMAKRNIDIGAHRVASGSQRRLVGGGRRAAGVVLRRIVVADHAEVLRLLAKRNIDIGSDRTRVVCRLHNVLMELSPGGIDKELNASDDARAARAAAAGDARPKRA